MTDWWSPEGVSALATAAAFLVGFALLRNESVDRSRREARGVGAELVIDLDTAVDRPSRTEDEIQTTLYEAEIVLYNSGDATVYDLAASFHPHDDAQPAGGCMFHFNAGVLRPGEEERFPLGFQVTYDTHMATLTRPGATVSFTDGIGKRWRRDHLGRLRREHPRLVGMSEWLRYDLGYRLKTRVRRAFSSDRAELQGE